MEVLVINVFIDGAHKLGQNQFVDGKILGYVEAICTTSGRRRGWRDFGNAIGKVTTVYVTPDEYVKLRNIIEEHYPGLCRFSVTKMEELQK